MSKSQRLSLVRQVPSMMSASKQRPPVVVVEERKEMSKSAMKEVTPMLKEVTYSIPNVKIGQGKFGPIDLIIYRGELHALKRIPKASIDKAKRIEHLKNEKKVNLILK